MRTLLGVILLSCSTAMGGGIYSYIDERGVKVFTNAPDRRPMQTEDTGEQAESDRADAYRPIIQRLAREHQVDEELVEAVMAVESNFNPTAVSVKNCKGLMQLHPDTAERFGVKDIFDPEENIEGGVKYLAFLTELFDRNLEHVLAAYNAGENAVLRHRGIPPYRETRDYIRKISKLYDVSRWQKTLVAEKRPGGRRVHRISLPDGRVVFTNTPSAYAHLVQ